MNGLQTRDHHNGSGVSLIRLKHVYKCSFLRGRGRPISSGDPAARAENLSHISHWSLSTGSDAAPPSDHAAFEL